MTRRTHRPVHRAAGSGRQEPGPAGPESWDRIGWHPDHVIEIAVSPQLRRADPGRPLSLLEALDIGGEPEREPEAEP